MLDNFRKTVICELIKILKNFTALTDIEKEVEKLMNNSDDAKFLPVIKAVTYLDLEEDESRRVFNELLDHWQVLNRKAERNVGLKVAALDYFMNINKKVDDVEIISANIFNQIKEDADKDKLTGLYNYAYYKKRLREEIFISKRYRKYFSLVVMDIDDFKKYNDAFGHDEGNVVLQKVSNTLVDTVRSADIVFRFGGEEFVLLLVETTKKGARIVAERARKKVSEIADLKSQVTISAGIATFPVDAEDSEKIFELADKGLYRAKEQGKNRVCFYHLERRNSLRIVSQLDASVLAEGDILPHVIEFKDISKGGIAFYTDQNIKINSKVSGDMVLVDKGKIFFSGKIVWKEKLDNEKYIAGMEFMENNENTAELISHYIDDRI